MSEYTGFYAEWNGWAVAALWLAALSVPGIIVGILAWQDWKAKRRRGLDDHS